MHLATDHRTSPGLVHQSPRLSPSQTTFPSMRIVFLSLSTNQATPLFSKPPTLQCFQPMFPPKRRVIPPS
ncbi:hypothetical protein FFLO_03579 [Filobasidium floriforme]|uniref:Uncharacterized protein n=1 Tax=Filobasidium floriforme TaxID=5210 RepID=A0A8K0JLV2_9TREE|nr:hypothetical protein FFLO_03579 [Filobasidium floriforme]